MSRRFGRNQRRRARELESGLRAETERLQQRLAWGNESQDNLRRELQILRQALQDAVRILGHTSAVLPPSTKMVPGSARPTVEVLEHERMLDWAHSLETCPAVAQAKILHVLAARYQREAWTGMHHVRVKFGDREAVHYAMSDEAVYHTPRDILARRIADELVSQLTVPLRGNTHEFERRVPRGY